MENRLYDVTALGELLIDFTENGESSQGNPTFEANPGGAPCNVLAMLNRLGKKTAFIGKVGNDMLANSLKVLSKNVESIPEILLWMMKCIQLLLLYILIRMEIVISLFTVIRVLI